MKGRAALSILVLCLLAGKGAAAGEKPEPLVRLAELEIDATRLAEYNAALRQEIETSIRLEPGVLNLYAVALKQNPALIRILEVYADETAYKAHLETAHFKKYKAATQGMVKQLRLIETTPILLGGMAGT